MASRQTGKGFRFWRRLSPLNNVGFSLHFILPVIVVLAVAGIGMRLLYGTHADMPYGEISGVGGKCLDDWEDKAVDFNKVEIWNCSGGTSQQWRYNTNGTITNENGFCLDVFHSKVTPGAQVDLYNCNGTAAQQWVVDAGVGTVTNPHSDMCLDDKQAITTNGNPIQTWSCLSDKQQQWKVSYGAVPLVAAAPTYTTDAATPSSCTKADGPFTVDRTNILDGNGRVFISYGATLSTPQYYPGTYTDNGTNDTGLTETEAQIKAIADGWCGNTVRLQIEQDMLVGTDGDTLNTAYLGFVKTIVSYAKQQGLAVVLNDQTEPGAAADTTLNEPLPSKATEAFWHQMDSVYAHDPMVIYDLFNEPRPNEFYATTQPEATLWNDWMKGGTYSYSYNGTTYKESAIGMQALADYVRADGAKNLYWIETAGNLDEIIENPGTYMINGDGPLAYEYHHTTNDGVARTEANWDAQFGDVVKDNMAPVVDGEWTNYSSFTGWRASNGDSGECWADAPTTVPQYLEYMQNLGIGMTVWTLGKGLMVSPNAKPGDYTIPTTMLSNWSCNTGLGQGAGQLVQNWFKQQNG